MKTPRLVRAALFPLVISSLLSGIARAADVDEVLVEGELPLTTATAFKLAQFTALIDGVIHDSSIEPTAESASKIKAELLISWPSMSKEEKAHQLKLAENVERVRQMWIEASPERKAELKAGMIKASQQTPRPPFDENQDRLQNDLAYVLRTLEAQKKTRPSDDEYYWTNRSLYDVMMRSRKSTDSNVVALSHRLEKALKERLAERPMPDIAELRSAAHR